MGLYAGDCRTRPVVSSNFNVVTIPALGARRKITASHNPSLTDTVEDHVQ
jgi:hypothetical protein